MDPLVVHDGVHFDDVEQSIPVIREEDLVPRITEATTTLSSFAQDDVQIFSDESASSASTREDSPTQQEVAQDGMQANSQFPLVRSIPIEQN